jgi:hypothetical protein
MVTTSIPLLADVDVWCASTSRWVPGFRIAKALGDGTFLLLGRDGGRALPEPFPPAVLRRTEATPRSPWGGVLAPA